MGNVLRGHWRMEGVQPPPKGRISRSQHVHVGTLGCSRLPTVMDNLSGFLGAVSARGQDLAEAACVRALGARSFSRDVVLILMGRRRAPHIDPADVDDTADRGVPDRSPVVRLDWGGAKLTPVIPKTSPIADVTRKRPTTYFHGP
jgi:hypothetical protein